jgi:prevent-host-death family protein
MKFRSLSEAKIELGTLVRLAENGETVVISRHGKPAVRLMPVHEEDFELSKADASRLSAWVLRERSQGRTREYSGMKEMLRKARPRAKKPRS